MKTLKQRLKQANASLAPYATPYEGRLGRVFRESEDTTRFPFQRDRDRIIHTQAFRRLQGKTQVFVTGSGDHYRTRLTHTMEVVQVSRDLARTLSLNEDLTECIALAHDLGHPPFGHAGEAALNEWLGSFGSSFEHNEQSHRIVTLLESHSLQYKGLNLNREILYGLRKHSTSPETAHTLEAQITDLADQIAYTAHDCDDGLRENIFTLQDILTIPIIREVHTQIQSRGTSLRGGIIDLLVHDLSHQRPDPPIHFTPLIEESLTELSQFLFHHMYNHPRILTAVEEGKNILLTLCQALYKSPTEKIAVLRTYTEGNLEESVKDFVAGMTDTFARQSVQKLAVPRRKR